MSNPLFQKARETVAIAEQATMGQADTNLDNAIDVAKNALSSAYANSTTAEKQQLRQMQERLDAIETH